MGGILLHAAQSEVLIGPFVWEVDIGNASIVPELINSKCVLQYHWNKWELTYLSLYNCSPTQRGGKDSQIS